MPSELPPCRPIPAPVRRRSGDSGRQRRPRTDATLLRLAAIGSTPLVSFMVVVLGALLAEALDHLRHRRTRSAFVSLVVLVGLTAAPLAVPLDSRAESGTLRVGAVQANVPTPGAEAMLQARTVAANHVAVTRALLAEVGRGRLDVVLWPESASDIDPRTDGELGAAVDSVARAVGAPILLGTQRLYPGLRYNDYILWEAGRGGTASYTKQHPVPFGEYIPYRGFFRKLSSAVDLITTDMAAGTAIALLPVPIERLGRSVPITTASCFEVAYDELIRESVLAGGEQHGRVTEPPPDGDEAGTPHRGDPQHPQGVGARSGGGRGVRPVVPGHRRTRPWVSTRVGRSAFIAGVRQQERLPPARPERSGRPAPAGAGASGAGR